MVSCLLYTSKRVPEVVVNAKSVERLPGTSSITFKYLEGESILLSLSYLGAVSYTHLDYDITIINYTVEKSCDELVKIINSTN